MNMSGKEKVVIIGGGIAGLAAGIYALNAGFEAEIYEKNAIPGGECMGWNTSKRLFSTLWRTLRLNCMPIS